MPPTSPSVGIVNCPFDADVAPGDPDELLRRYRTLVDWVDALVEAGAGAVTVVQRFHRDLRLRRGGADYRFVADDTGVTPLRPWFWGERVVGATLEIAADVVQVHGLVFPLLVRHLRLRLPPTTALLVQDHGGIHAGSPGFSRWRWRALHRLGLRAADGFLFSTRELAAPWRRAGIVGEAQAIHEIPEAGTSLPSERSPAGRADDAGGTGRLPGRPALLWIGRLDANKDPLTVLRGLERALAELPGAALTMVYGGGDLLGQVKRAIAASPALAGRVHLMGRQDRSALPAIYAGADLFVLGSHHEGSGFALIEALSFGVIPVITDIPSFRAFTDGGRLGALFPVGDAPALAAALVRLGREDLGARRAAVRAHFDAHLGWPAVGRRALAIYRDAAAARRRSVAEARSR